MEGGSLAGPLLIVVISIAALAEAGPKSDSDSGLEERQGGVFTAFRGASSSGQQPQSPVYITDSSEPLFKETSGQVLQVHDSSNGFPIYRPGGAPPSKNVPVTTVIRPQPPPPIPFTPRPTFPPPQPVQPQDPTVVFPQSQGQIPGGTQRPQFPTQFQTQPPQVQQGQFPQIVSQTQAPQPQVPQPQVPQPQFPQPQFPQPQFPQPQAPQPQAPQPQVPQPQVPQPQVPQPQVPQPQVPQPQVPQPLPPQQPVPTQQPQQPPQFPVTQQPQQPPPPPPPPTVAVTPPPPPTAPQTQPPPPPTAAAAAAIAPPAGAGAGPTQQCHVRTCEQTITGRQLSYSRALEIVENEEYLTAADRDIIRRRFKRQTFLRVSISKNPVDDDDVPDGIVPAVTFGGPLLAAALPVSGGAPSTPPQQQQPQQQQNQQQQQQQQQTQPAASSLTSSPLPGAFGAGASVALGGLSAVQLLAVGLAPPGTTPVSVFPPYARPRTRPAIAVIFRENNGINGGDGTARTEGAPWWSPTNWWGNIKRRLRIKRQAFKWDNQAYSGYRNQIDRARAKFANVFNVFKKGLVQIGELNSKEENTKEDQSYEDRQYQQNHIENAHYHGGHNTGYEHHHHNDHSHYDSNHLEYDQFFGHQHHSYEGHHHGYQPVYGPQTQQASSEEQQQMEQCQREGNCISEDDLFGFRVKVVLVNETCTLGVTCDNDGNRLSGGSSVIGNNGGIRNTFYFFKRQGTGEEFQSDAPAECRTQLRPECGGQAITEIPSQRFFFT